MSVHTLLGQVGLNMIGDVMYGSKLLVCDSDGKLISEISHSDLEKIVDSQRQGEFDFSDKDRYWTDSTLREYIETLYNGYVRRLEYSTEGMIAYEDKIQELTDLLGLDYLCIAHGEINAKKMMKKLGLARKDPDFDSPTHDPLYHCDKVRRIGEYYFFLS